MTSTTPATEMGIEPLVERVATHLQLWWMTQKHEPMHRNDALDLARAAIAASTRTTGGEQS